MKNLTPEKKVTWIIRIAIILFLIPLIALQIYVCKTYNIPGPVGFICIIRLEVIIKQDNILSLKQLADLIERPYYRRNIFKNILMGILPCG